jgi:hypothetical protein
MSSRSRSPRTITSPTWTGFGWRLYGYQGEGPTLPSMADWIDTGQIFLVRNPEIDWSTGRPIWTRKHYNEHGQWVERKFIVNVNLEEI